MYSIYVRALHTGKITIVTAGMIFISFTWASAVSVGDLVSSVVEELGRPPNTMTIGSRTIFDYDRGRIEIENGIVSSADLITEEQSEERRKLRDDTRIRQLENEKTQRVQRLQEGLALRSATLKDPNFLRASASHRVSFWQRFSDRFPDIPVEDEHRHALRQLLDEQAVSMTDSSRESRGRSQRLIRLEEEVLEAKLRALQAEEQAARARQHAAERQGADQVDDKGNATVNITVNLPYVETVVVPGSPVSVLAPPPMPAAPLSGRYSISRRLPPQGTPTFGGARVLSE